MPETRLIITTVKALPSNFKQLIALEEEFHFVFVHITELFNMETDSCRTVWPNLRKDQRHMT